MDAIFQEFLAEAGVTFRWRTPRRNCRKRFKTLFADVDRINARRIAILEEQRENLRKRLETGGGFLNKFLSNAPDPAD